MIKDINITATLNEEHDNYAKEIKYDNINKRVIVTHSLDGIIVSEDTTRVKNVYLLLKYLSACGYEFTRFKMILADDNDLSRIYRVSLDTNGEFILDVYDGSSWLSRLLCTDKLYIILGAIDDMFTVGDTNE